MVSGIVPAPPDRGDRIRGYEMLQALREFGEVHLAVTGSEVVRPTAAQALDTIGVHVQQFPVSATERLLEIAGAALSGRPWGTWRAARVANELRAWDSRWDLVIGFQLKSAYYAANVPAQLRVLELTDSLGLYRRMLPAFRNPVRWLSLSGAAREEARWAARFDATFVCAEQDALEIAKHAASSNIHIVANGAECWDVPVSATVRKDSLLFVGSLHYPPNRDGLRWLIREVWPSVAASHPELSLRVVGEGPHSSKRLASGPRVCWTGYLPDLAPEYERALALVNPVQYGTGTRRKILYAWGAGVPVVSTSEGAKGLHGQSGKHLMIADQPEEFARAIDALSSKPDVWAGLSTSGWELARNHYGPKNIWGQALRNLFGARLPQDR